jgi:hypothetical protein
VASNDPTASGAAEFRLRALEAFSRRLSPPGDDHTPAVDAVAVEVIAAFEESGIDALLLKGRALAASLYRAGEHRGYSDADLLVAPKQSAAAEAVLKRLGYVEADAVRGIDDVAGVIPGSAWVRVSATSSPEVDLHRWLPGASGDPEVAWRALSRHRTWMEIRGRRVAVLDLAGQAMHLALHAAQHGPKIPKHVTELALALDRWPREIWEGAALLASEIGAVEPFAAGLRLLPRGAVEASDLGLPATKQLDWAITHRDSRPRGTFHLRSFAEAKTSVERIRILRRALLPGRAWIVFEHPWAGRGGLRILVAYALHIARAPLSAARAWRFTRRAKRAAR